MLPYSQLVWEMEKRRPGVYNIPFRFQFNAAEVNIELLQKAIGEALHNHPILILMGDSFFDIKVWTEDRKGYIGGRINRILGDSQSMLILLKDIGQAYVGDKLIKDDYLSYLEKYFVSQRTIKIIEHKEKLIQHYSNIICPVRPDLDYPLNNLEEWISAEKILPIVIGEHPKLSKMQQVCLAVSIAIMDYCGTDESALTWAYLGRDTIDEQYIYGSLHKDIPMRIHRANSVEEYIHQVRQECRTGIACSDYPLTLTPPFTEIWNYAVNVLEQPNIQQVLDTFPFSIEPVPVDDDQPKLAYSLLDIEIEDRKLVFKYSATHYKKESILKFAQMVQQNIKWLIQ